jgi:hypothetical protein
MRLQIADFRMQIEKLRANQICNSICNLNSAVSIRWTDAAITATTRLTR